MFSCKISPDLLISCPPAIRDSRLESGARWPVPPFVTFTERSIRLERIVSR